MGVHVSQLHTDVRPSEGSEHGPDSGPGAAHGATGETVDQRWRESRGRTDWLARRVAAEGFDD